MLVKTAPVKLKEIGSDDGSGTFEAVVSVFGNVDSYGDVVVKGAFADTLKEWEASGSPIPVLYSHNSYDPDYNVGHVLEASETDEGLQIRAQLDVDADTGKAKQVHRLLTQKRVTQFSFAYDVIEAGSVTVDGQDFYQLSKLKLYEVGPCLIGANQETRLIGAKHDGGAIVRAATSLHGLAAELKAGRALSAANEGKIRSAVDALAEVLSALDSADDDDAKRRVADAAKTSRLPEAEALERELAQLA